MNPLFVLDSNIFIEAHRRYYGFNLCPGFWTCVRHYSGEGRIVSLDRVRDELLVGNDALAEWVKEGPDELFVSTAAQKVGDAFEEVTEWVQSNRQFRSEAKENFAAGADGWLAAYAMVHGTVVVTHESYSPNVKRRVPLANVCIQFGLVARDTFEMLADLDVHFHWRKE